MFLFVLSESIVNGFLAFTIISSILIFILTFVFMYRVADALKNEGIKKIVDWIFAVIMISGLATALFYGFSETKLEYDQKKSERLRIQEIEKKEKEADLSPPKSEFPIIALKNDLSLTHNYMQKWLNDESSPNEPFKLEAVKLLDGNLITYTKLNNVAGGNKKGLKTIKENLNELISLYNNVRFSLPDIESYSDETSLFIAQTTFELDIKPLYDETMEILNKLGGGK